MSLEVVHLANVGVEVRGFDIREPMSDKLQGELVDLWNEHAVLLFRGQAVTPENQIAFSRLFGELELHPIKETTSAEHPELFTSMNGPEKERAVTARYDGKEVVGRLDWHMDLQYTGKTNRGALLSSVVCAQKGGLTGFCDLALAYDSLDADTKALLEKLEVVYTFSAQRRHMRFVDLVGYEPGLHSPRTPADVGFPDFPDVAYPAVIPHPVTGRRVLHVCEQFLDRIVAPHNAGLCNDEAVELLTRLVAHTRKPELHYFHCWQPGDMVLWDNWRAMHCATGVPPGTQRVIHRTTIAGDRTLGRVLERY